MNIGYGINLCSKLIRNKLNKELEVYKITAVQLSVLKIIESNKDQPDFNTAVAISKALDMDKPTMSAIVSRLIEKNYLEKKEHPTDGRSNILVLTDRYREYSEEFKEVCDKVEDSLFEGFNESELVILKKYLNKILNNIR